MPSGTKIGEIVLLKNKVAVIYGACADAADENRDVRPSTSVG